jgi:hypothetical protein
MTRTMISLFTAAVLVVASSVTVPAQGRKGSTPKPQHVTSKGTTTKASSPKTTKASSPKTTKASSPKTTKASSPKATKASSPKATKASSPKTTNADAKSATKSARADAKATKTETPMPLTRVQERLQKNTKLAERLEGRMPKGVDLMEAAEGFKNLGQFVAAVNVSSNLRLDFDKLKTAMVDDGRSLGQAIQYVKSDVENPTLVAQRAESEAQTLIQQTEKTTAATTTTSTTSQKTKPKDKPKQARAGSGS